MFSLKVLLKEPCFAAGFANKIGFTLQVYIKIKFSLQVLLKNWVFAAGFAEKLSFRCRFCSKNGFSMQVLLPKCAFTCVFTRFWGAPGPRGHGPAGVKVRFPGCRQGGGVGG